MPKAIKEGKQRIARVSKNSFAIKKSQTPEKKKNLKMPKEAGEETIDVLDDSGEGDDLRSLILSIKKTQCTKYDMQLFTESVNSKLVEIESKVTSQDAKIESMNHRLDKCENQAASAQHQMELEKQRSLKNNVSIFGVGRTDGENLMQIVLKVFNKMGCDVADNQVINCYRINGNNNNIIIAKLSDYELKQKILKEKIKNPVKLSDVIGCSNAADTIIYINNHVTPFFGKLLHEGRKAVKSGDIHSCWLNSFGCQMKYEEDGKQHAYRTIDDLKILISKKTTVNKASKKRSTPDDRSPNGNKNKTKK